MTTFKGFDDWVPIFKGGKQIDSHGCEHDGDALIDNAIAKFNIAVHEPPAVIGHPKENAPAYGWVEGLKKQGDILLAKFKQVQPAFADMVKQGLFKKRSAAFYPDGSLRHVGFLGAMPPAVKGLSDVAFTEADAVTFEFAEDNWRMRDIADVFRRLREWLLEKFDADTADRIVPNWTIEDIRAAPEPVAAEAEIQSVQYIEKEDNNMTFKEKLIAFFNEFIGKMPDDGPAPLSVASGKQFSEADIEAAKRQAAEDAAKVERERLTAEFAEKARLARQAACRAEISAWCEAKVKEGKMTPAMVKFGVPEFMTAFAEKEDIIEFGEEKTKATLYDRFKDFFETELPKVVTFGEVAIRSKDAGGQGSAGEKLTALVNQKMKDNKELTYSAAFSEVQKENTELAAQYAAELKEV